MFNTYYRLFWSVDPAIEQVSILAIPFNWSVRDASKALRQFGGLPQDCTILPNRVFPIRVGAVLRDEIYDVCIQTGVVNEGWDGEIILAHHLDEVPCMC